MARGHRARARQILPLKPQPCHPANPFMPSLNYIKFVIDFARSCAVLKGKGTLTRIVYCLEVAFECDRISGNWAQ